jgi:hypothetical protein
MGRTISSFRIAAILEGKTWKDRKIFDGMFVMTILYNSASFYDAIPIRICPIMMSIAFTITKL